jgi:predicted amidohydrolase
MWQRAAAGSRAAPNVRASRRALATLAAMEITVAALQMSSQGNVDENLAEVSRLTGLARRRGATVVVLPENFAFIGDTEAGKLAVAERLPDGPIVRFLRRLAQESAVAIVAGGMPEASDDAARPYNTSVFIAADGEIVARYRKVHLFDVELADGTTLKESAATTPGREAVTAPTHGTTLGMSICYDLRFPELYRRLVDAGSRIVTVPSAFTLTTGKDHWHALLRARAIENQVYVVAAAQHGKHPRGRTTYGKSLIVDPWGEVVAQASEGVGMAVATLDLAYVDRVRAQIPCLTHRVMDKS